MQRPLLLAGFALLFAIAHATGSNQDDAHASLASHVIDTYTPVAAERPAAAARAFLAALDQAQRAKLQLDLDDPERRNWTNVPPSADEKGLRLGELDEAQLERACDLLASVLSTQGYTQTRDILIADDLLLSGGRARVGFGVENFWLVLFGEPSDSGAWALQLDGHHLAWNLSFDGDERELSPAFVGTQPAHYRRGEDDVRPMQGEVQRAFELIAALDPEQQRAARVGERRGRMQAGAGRDGAVPEVVGVACQGFSEIQRGALRALLAEYVGDMPAAWARERMAALEAEIDSMHFAWSGPLEAPADVSYRLQGPSVIIEFACQDLGGDPLQHLHSIYRNPHNEYGGRSAK